MVLEEVLDNLKIDDKEFGKTFSHYVGDEANHDEIGKMK